LTFEKKYPKKRILRTEVFINLIWEKVRKEEEKKNVKKRIEVSVLAMEK